METKNLPLSQIFPNIGQIEGLKKNPRIIKNEKYKKLLQSIKEDPEMLELRELIVYDTNDPDLGYVVVGGNMRYKALKELGYTEAPCKILHHGFPIEKMRRIVLKDNSDFGEWDLDTLIKEWDIEDITSAAIDIPDLGSVPTLEEPKEEPKAENPQPQEEPAQQTTEMPQQRLESKGEIDPMQFDTKQTLKLDFTPEEYMYVLDRLREYGDDYPQSLLIILGYDSDDEESHDYNDDEREKGENKAEEEDDKYEDETEEW